MFGISYTSGGAFHPDCGQLCIGSPVLRFPQVICESNVAAFSFSAEWLVGTRHVNIHVLEFASTVFALLMWAHPLRDTVVNVGGGLVA